MTTTDHYRYLKDYVDLKRMDDIPVEILPEKINKKIKAFYTFHLLITTLTSITIHCVLVTEHQIKG